MPHGISYYPVMISDYVWSTEEFKMGTLDSRTDTLAMIGSFQHSDCQKIE
jgi:hypothetical protein